MLRSEVEVKRSADLLFPATTSTAPSLLSFNTHPATTEASKPFNFNISPTTSAAPQLSTQPAVPAFSFLKPTTPKVSSPTEPASASSVLLQIDSQTSAKRPSIGSYKFSSIQNEAVPSTNTTPVGSPVQFAPKDLSFASPSQSAQSQRPNQTPSSAAPFPPTIPEEPQPEQIDEEKLLEHLCRIGLVQKDGILDMFVLYKISRLVKDAFKDFQDQRFAKQTGKR